MVARVCSFFSVVLLICLVSGCGNSKTPTGPELGSVQAYLDENPDVAARVNEGDGGDVEEDDDTYDDE